MLTSTTGVVVAAGSLGSNEDPELAWEALTESLRDPDKDSSKSQYCPPEEHDDSDSDTARDRDRDSDSDSDCDDSDSDGD
jgi:hypothetical protein